MDYAVLINTLLVSSLKCNLFLPGLVGEMKGGAVIRYHIKYAKFEMVVFDVALETVAFILHCIMLQN